MLSCHGPKATEEINYGRKPKLCTKISLFSLEACLSPVICYCFRRLTLLSNQYVLHKHHHLDLDAWPCFLVWKLHAGDASHNELKSSYKCKNLWASALYKLLSIKRVWASALYNYSVLEETVFWFLQDAIWHMNEYRHRPHSQIQKTNSLQNSLL